MIGYRYWVSDVGCLAALETDLHKVLSHTTLCMFGIGNGKFISIQMMLYLHVCETEMKIFHIAKLMIF